MSPAGTMPNVLTRTKGPRRMAGIRSDYVSERQFIRHDPDRPPAKSPFLPGNEKMTKPSVLSLVAREGLLQRLQDGEEGCVRDWSIRFFESSNPVVSTGADQAYGDRPRYSEPAYGHHYVLVATRDPGDTLATLSADRWFDVLLVIQDRMRWLYSKRGVSYVAVYADHGAAAGDAYSHPHVNLVGLPSVPAAVRREEASCNRIQAERGACPVCETVEAERGGPREVLEAHGYVALAPWAPSRPRQFVIYPTAHSSSFRKAGQQDMKGLSHMMRSTLGGMTSVLGDVPYHLVFHLPPESKKTRTHWYIEVCPLTGAPTGLEHGYGICLGDEGPEEYAQRLGTACRREFAAMMGIE